MILDLLRIWPSVNGGFLHGSWLISKDSMCAKCLLGEVLGMVLCSPAILSTL